MAQQPPTGDGPGGEGPAAGWGRFQDSYVSFLTGPGTVTSFQPSRLFFSLHSLCGRGWDGECTLLASWMQSPHTRRFLFFNFF